ncbi:hypothetical protein MPH47_14000 [Psychrobacillus psychrodurans]|uniref:hypothetical protein n=1 Tax=Psychrobacillus psychrodurans TaxID=126157 RepID=UPI001F4DF35B|nr:hypothetical protein [Psychrobacillus psychrodurans]MCK1998313.1 hypothetical protein [Psychrobacillus psychrodurans]
MTIKLEEIKKTITLAELYPGSIYDNTENKLLRPQHRVIYSTDFPKPKKPSILEQFANVEDVPLKRAPLTTLEGQANKLLLDAERMEQALARICPPVTDRAYVEKADFTVTDLYNDIVSRMEWTALRCLALISVFGIDALSTFDTVLDWDYYREERKKWRGCRYKYCLNMYAVKGDNLRGEQAKRSDSRYCSEGCRKATHEAEERYKISGSYLPVYYYMDQLTDSIGDKIRYHEGAYLAKDIDNQHAKGKVMSPMKTPKRTVYTGGEITTYKTLVEAKKAYENAENKGKTRI